MRPGTLPTTEKFLSTPSVRRATGAMDGTEIDITISIHALREEGDTKNLQSI